MKFLIVNYYMKPGGIATSLNNLLVELAKSQNNKIDLLLLNPNVDQRYNIPNEVNLIEPSSLLRVYSTSIREIVKGKSIKDKVVAVFLHSIAKIIGEKNLLEFIASKEIIRESYDVAISYSNDIYRKNASLITRSFSGGCNYLVDKKVDSKIKLAWVHNDPIELGFDYKRCKESYEKFDTIINVSNACKDKFDLIIPEFKNKSKVIYNVLDLDKMKSLASLKNPYSNLKEMIFVTVARIDIQQKRIDRIIKVCEMLKNEQLDEFKWYIIGDGPELSKLKQLVKEKGLDKKVIFEGYKKNPYPYIQNADCFVLSSKYEAYPMVTIESLALNTPVITTEYAAAHEQVSNNKTGIVVKNDTKSLYEGMKRIIKNKGLISIFKQNLELELKNKESIVTEINNLIEKVKNNEY